MQKQTFKSQLWSYRFHLNINLHKIWEFDLQE